MKKIFVILLSAVLLPNVYAKKPLTLFLVGDETMAELTQPEDITDAAAVGWGQVLPQYLPEDAIVENHASDGATTKSLLQEGSWSAILNRAPRGSMMFIQFGHHEYNEEDAGHYSNLETFENNLLEMLKDAKKKGVKVVLLTPTAKNFFMNNVLYPRHGAYAEGVRRVAAHAHLPLIDVDALTSELFEARGADGSQGYFANGDAVRLNKEGATAVAKLVVETAKEQKILK